MATFSKKLLCEETITDAVDHQYTANVAVTEDNTTVDNAVHNLENAFAANTSIVSQLTEANTTLNNEVQHYLTNLQEQINSVAKTLNQMSLTSQQRQRAPPLQNQLSLQPFMHVPHPYRTT